jgi:hypothetical protein
MLMVSIPVSLVPIWVLAESCGDYPLTQEQSSYLAMQSLDIAIPEGEVPLITRCDVDGNNVVDNNDLFIIREHRGEVPVHPDDPMDWDGDHIIHGRDVGGCASSCTSKGCAVKTGAKKKKGGKASAESSGGVAVPANCFQVEDFDGDGSQDFFGLYEYTGSNTRANEWILQLVILTEDNIGNVQHTLFPYSGRVIDGDLANHLSLQPAGVVDLNPGSVTIDEPGVVSYRNGEPKVLFYYDNGTLAKAFYGIID